jgi:glucoamylase
MENFAGECALIPEQVWDSDDLPSRHMFLGCPTGSAMPLVWSHAEYIKLLHSEHDGRVFDLLAPVRKRYIDEEAATAMQVWTFKQKIREFSPERPLRIEVYAPSRLHWTHDNWTTIQDTPLSHDGLGVYGHEFAIGCCSSQAALKFTFYWILGGRWEGRDFSIAVREVPENAAETENPDAREIDRNEKKEFQPHLG